MSMGTLEEIIDETYVHGLCQSLQSHVTDFVGSTEASYVNVCRHEFKEFIIGGAERFNFALTLPVLLQACYCFIIGGSGVLRGHPQLCGT